MEVNVEIKSLTFRQKELLAMAARGSTYKEIARFCDISENTVKNTFSFARQRLAATTTAQAICKAISREELGLDHNGVCFVPTALETAGRVKPGS